MRKYNQSGVTHLLLPLIIVGLIATLGTIFYMRSNAAVAAPIYRIASYNILGSEHAADGRRIGGTVADRATRETNIIRGIGEDPAFDVVGIQEMMPDQSRLFNNKLAAYDHFPSHSAQKTIYWRSGKFRRVASGTLRYPFYGDNGLTAGGLAYWVKLQDRQTNTQFYVLNVHPVAWNNDPGSDRGGAQKRERTAHIVRNWVAAKKRTGRAVFVTGDMNSAFYIRIYDKNFHERVKDNYIAGQRGRLPYCIMTNLGVMQNTYDMVRGARGHCPTHGISVIDHIYATTTNVRVIRWKRINTVVAKHASDHMPVYIEARVSNSSLYRSSSVVGSTPVSTSPEIIAPVDALSTADSTVVPDEEIGSADTDGTLPEDELTDAEAPSTVVSEDYAMDPIDPSVTEDTL